MIERGTELNKAIIPLIIIILLVSSLYGSVSHQTDKVTIGKPSNMPARDLQNSSWSMFHHDQNHSGYSTSTAPSSNNVLWSYQTGNSTFLMLQSSPAVVNGRVYVGSGDNKMYCLDADTGAKIWDYTTGYWVMSSPAVADGKIYFGSLDQNIYCLDADTGVKIWNYATRGNIGSSPTVVNGKLYIGSVDGNIYCLDAENGVKIWNYSTPPNVVLSSPAVTNERVYFGSDDHNVYCLDAETGEKIWNYTTNGPVSSSPTVGYGKIFIGSRDHQIYCLDAETGVKIWNYTTFDDVLSSPAVANEKIYIGSNQKLYCFNAFTGLIIWDYSIGGHLWSSPAIADEKVFIGCYQNEVFCFNAETGVPVWTYSTSGPVKSSPAIANGNVYIDSEDGWLYCFGKNQPPNPPTINGPHYGKINTLYSFSLGAITDPDGDQLYGLWDWGDGNTSGWLGPYNSGETVSTSHAWVKPGNYTIKVKIKDSGGAESNGSAPFFITIVQLKPAFFLGTFKNINQTEDLIIMRARSFIVFPSNSIFNKGKIIVLSKDYHGYVGIAFALGVGCVAIP
jgi:outer membrane protein assembly factor BamB